MTSSSFLSSLPSIHPKAVLATFINAVSDVFQAISDVPQLIVSSASLQKYSASLRRCLFCGQEDFSAIVPGYLDSEQVQGQISSGRKIHWEPWSLRPLQGTTWTFGLLWYDGFQDQIKLKSHIFKVFYVEYHQRMKSSIEFRGLGGL